MGAAIGRLPIFDQILAQTLISISVSGGLDCACARPAAEARASCRTSWSTRVFRAKIATHGRWFSPESDLRGCRESQSTPTS
jgi:hypothetical protein